jgi:hypothetical protein
VTFTETIAALSDRFLTERSFDLIVGPALADFEFDDPAIPMRTRRAAVMLAFAGAVWDDIVCANAWTFAALVLIPACYYFFFFLLGIPGGPHSMPADLMTTLGIAVITLSLAPAIVCFWPERPAPKSPAER